MALTFQLSLGESTSRNWITDAVPQELQGHVLSYLDLNALAQMSRVSSHWQSAASDDKLWERFWDTYHITDMTLERPKKIVMGQFISEQLRSWESFLQWDPIPYENVTNWLGDIKEKISAKDKTPLQKYASIMEKTSEAPAFLKSILQMSEPIDDQMRTDFFFHYLRARLPIMPIISDANAIFDIYTSYDRPVPRCFTLATFLLNIRQGNLAPLMEFCNLRSNGTRRLLKLLPPPNDNERTRLTYQNACDPHFLLIGEFTNVVYFSKGATFSELFNCPGFNPNFLLPSWVNFVRGSNKTLQAVTSEQAPFISIFISHFFLLPGISRQHLEDDVGRSTPYASWDLPFDINPQLITLEQLFEDLKILVSHPEIDLQAKDSKGRTPRELVQTMLSEADSDEDLHILERILSILEAPRRPKDNTL